MRKLFALLTAFIMTVSAFSVFIYYRLKFYKELNGITGDTAGWFLQVCELVTAFSILIQGGI